MKKLIIILILFISISLYANDYLTIYNQNQALYKTTIDLDLQRGTQYFSFENIPTTIITESVIFIPRNRNLQLFSQNFEYDLANTHKMMQRYINRNVRLTTDNENYSGTLMFFDHGNYGIRDEATNELNIINAQKVNNVLLPEMPDDFYVKPTLRWQLNADRAATYQADLSYLMNGMDWRATYNAVLGKNNFTLNSWVTINNRSGKDYRNVNLKLIAGDVSTHQQMLSRATPQGMMSFDAMGAAPSFEERAFSDFRIYTLDQTADIDNNQEKQLRLYPLKTVNFTRKYQYTVQGAEVDVFINFTNSERAGLGVPLPRGNINFYEIDEKDNTQQFVGFARINNTSLNQEVSLRIGSAFDIIAETKIVNQNTSNRIRTMEFEITLTNNKTEAVDVTVTRNSGMSGGTTEILNPSSAFERINAFTNDFNIRIPAGRTQTLTFTERVNF